MSEPIRLREEAGWVTRTLLFLSGLTLIAATLVSAYHDWPLIIAGKLPPLGFFLICFIALPIGMLILIWSAIGEKRDWILEKNQVRIRTMSLTAWQSSQSFELSDIAEVSWQSVPIGGRQLGSRHWVEVMLLNRKRLRSPIVADADSVKLIADFLGRAKSDAA